jgi:hypothetical protein
VAGGCTVFACGENFLRQGGMAEKDDRPLKAGDKITGTVRLTLAVPTFQKPPNETRK